MVSPPSPANPLPSPVELVIRAGNAERYTIVPDELALEAGASATVEVRLRLTKPPPRQRSLWRWP